MIFFFKQVTLIRYQWRFCFISSISFILFHVLWKNSLSTLYSFCSSCSSEAVFKKNISANQWLKYQWLKVVKTPLSVTTDDQPPFKSFSGVEKPEFK